MGTGKETGRWSLSMGCERETRDLWAEDSGLSRVVEAALNPSSRIELCTKHASVCSLIHNHTSNHSSLSPGFQVTGQAEGGRAPSSTGGLYVGSTLSLHQIHYKVERPCCPSGLWFFNNSFSSLSQTSVSWHLPLNSGVYVPAQ